MNQIKNTNFSSEPEVEIPAPNEELPEINIDEEGIKPEDLPF